MAIKRILIKLIIFIVIFASNSFANVSVAYVPEKVSKGLLAPLSHHDPNQTLNLRFLLNYQNQAVLKNYIAGLNNPKSPFYHRYLTSAEFHQQFPVSTIDSDAVISNLKAHGLNVSKPKGIVISLSAKVSDIEKSFNVRINDYQDKITKRIFFAPDREPAIDSTILDKIKIVGLDNAIQAQPMFHRVQLSRQNSLNTAMVKKKDESGVFPLFRSVGTYNGAYIQPSDIYTAYNMNGITANGTNQTLALFELDAYNPNDITTYLNKFNLTAVPLTNIPINPFNGSIAGAGTDEVVLDIDMANAFAPGLSHILVYEAQNSSVGWVDEWQRIADDNLASVISDSWGIPEGYYAFYNIDNILMQMAAQGQTVFVAAGDAGAYANCPNGELPPACTNTALAVMYPASSPYVTGVGISALTVNDNGTYYSETASQFGGGGISTLFQIPGYQQGLTFKSPTPPALGPSTTMRNVPDVVLTADPSSLYYVYLSDPTYGPNWYGMWGSSVATPIWAAFMARVNQENLQLGKSLIGFLTPQLYTILGNSALYASDFNNISTGYNCNPAYLTQYPCYQAETGYNDAAGLGSFNGGNLFDYLISPTVPGAPGDVTAIGGNTQATVYFAVPSNNGGSAITNYTVTSSPGSFKVTGASSPITVTGLTNGTAYTFTVTATNTIGVSAASPQSNSVTPESHYTITTSSSNGSISPQGSVSVAPGTDQTFTFTPNYGYDLNSIEIDSSLVSSLILPTTIANVFQYTFKTVSANHSIYALFGSNQYGSGPVITSQPSNQTVNVGSTATFSISSTGEGTQNYQWYVSTNGGSLFSAISGATNSSYSVQATSSTPGSDNGTIFVCVVTDRSKELASSNAVMLTVTNITVPGAPTIGTAIAGNAQATVSFTPPSYNGGSVITGYTVTSSPGSITATGTASPLTVTGLTNGTAYTFTVTATNANGTSVASIPSNRVTPGIFYTITTSSSNGLISPQGSVSVAPGANQTFTFTPNHGYNFIYSEIDSSQFLTVLPSIIANTFEYTLLNVQSNHSIYALFGSNQYGSGPVITSQPSNQTVNVGSTATFSISSTGEGTQNYQWYVSTNGGSLFSAISGATNSSYSVQATSSTPGSDNGTIFVCVVTDRSKELASSNAVTLTVHSITVPGFPTNVSAIAGNGSATVSFSAPSNNGGSAITSYKVTASDGITTGVGTASPIIVSGLTNGTSYTFTVTAINDVGTGPASAASNPVTPATVPGAPTIGTAIAGNAQATVSFTPPSYNGGSVITGYTVISSPGSITAMGTASPLTVIGLTNGTAYTFTVTATNIAGTSAASAVSNSVTPFIPPPVISNGVPTGTVAPINGTNANVTLSVTTNEPATCRYSTTPNTLFGAMTNTMNDNGTTHNSQVNGLPGGNTYSYYVRCADSLGNATTTDYLIRFSVFGKAIGVPIGSVNAE